MGRLTAAEVAVWLQASCEGQSLSIRVTDPDVLGRVAAVLATRSGLIRTAQLEPSTGRVERGPGNQAGGGAPAAREHVQR